MRTNTVTIQRLLTGLYQTHASPASQPASRDNRAHTLTIFRDFKIETIRARLVRSGLSRPHYALACASDYALESD